MHTDVNLQLVCKIKKYFTLSHKVFEGNIEEFFWIKVALMKLTFEKK